jgi:hypothetical protein
LSSEERKDFSDSLQRNGILQDYFTFLNMTGNFFMRDKDYIDHETIKNEIAKNNFFDELRIEHSRTYRPKTFNCRSFLQKALANYAKENGVSVEKPLKKVYYLEVDGQLKNVGSFTGRVDYESKHYLEIADKLMSSGQMPVILPKV